MLNPYTILNEELLNAMLRQPMYFVRQQYPRGRFLYDAGEMKPLLFTHYAHHEVEKERAQRHMRLLLKDPYRFLYDSTIPEHREKLLIAARQPDGYRIYVNLMATKWKASASLKSKISRYMLHHLPWWNYSPSDKLKVTLRERYGDLYLALLWKGQKTEVHLDEIENFSECATT
jgi:hypothetical protein